ASAASVGRLSARPCASFASVFAVQGATTRRTAGTRCGKASSGGAGCAARAPGRRERAEGLGADEALRARGEERDDLVPRSDEEADELAGLVGGDAAG